MLLRWELVIVKVWLAGLVPWPVEYVSVVGVSVTPAVSGGSSSTSEATKLSAVWFTVTLPAGEPPAAAWARSELPALTWVEPVLAWIRRVHPVAAVKRLLRTGTP